jgi:hypothetical protein
MADDVVIPCTTLLYAICLISVCGYMICSQRSDLLPGVLLLSRYSYPQTIRSLVVIGWTLDDELEARLVHH